MRKRIVLLLGVMLLVCMQSAAALAYEMNMAPKSRILPGIPEGMAATYTVSDGRVDILIDTYETDWDMVVSAARKSGSLAIHPGIEKPANMLKEKSQSDYTRGEDNESLAAGDAAICNMIANWGNGRDQAYASSKQGWAIGRYDEGTGLFIPEEILESDGARFGVCWVDGNNNLYFERVMITVRYTKVEPIYTKKQDVESKHIAANVTVNNAKVPAQNLKNVSVENGRIVYELKNLTNMTWVHTAIAAPNWLKADREWKAYLLSEGLKTELTICDGSDFGLKNSCVVVSQRIGNERGVKDAINKYDWSIQWVDPDGKTQEVFYLEAEFLVNEPKYIIAYDQNAEPVPAANVTWTTKNPLGGLGASYNGETGVFHLSIDEDKLPTNGKTDLSATTVSVGVDAPENAAYCVVSLIQGDVIYGDNGEAQMRLGELPVEKGKPVYALELIDCIYFRELTATLHNGKTMSYYVAPSMVGRYGGMTIIFEWKTSQSKTIGKKQYVTLTTDAYELLERMSPSLSDKPKDPLTEPMVQTQTDGLYVRSARLPQKGDDVIRYEIALMEGNGQAVQPDEPVLVYLPYPDKKTMEECLYDTFVVYHQLSDGSYEEYSTDNGKLTLTKQGLCMEVDSFSPYFLNWKEGEAPAASQLPETGDHSRLFAAMLTMAGALSLMAMMKKRKIADGKKS